jgi:hypothetical protein
MEFWTKLGAQLYFIVSKIERQCRFKVKLNDSWMNLHRN